MLICYYIMKTKNSCDLFHNKTEQELCADIKEYLKGKSGIPIPSLEDFCIKNNYTTLELENFAYAKDDLTYAIDDIETRAIVTLERYLMLDLTDFEFKTEGQSFKLDKKGIIYKLRELKKTRKNR